MESLAILVTILLLVAFLSGPIAIGLTKIKTSSFPLMLIRRVFHGFFVAISLWVGLMFFINPDAAFGVHLIGLYGLIMGYIAFRREYMPHLRIITPLLTRLGFRKSSNNKSINNAPGQGESTSRYGPILKWRRTGHSGGNDGHGPEGQH